MQDNHSIAQGKEDSQNQSWFVWILGLLGVQLLPSLAVFYLIWPMLFQWQLGQELAQVDPQVVDVLQKEESYLEGFHHRLEKEELADTYTKTCLLLPCRLTELSLSRKTKSQTMVSSINLQLALDIYDIPIALEVMARAHPSIQLQQLEVHHYNETKLLLRYEQNLPSFLALDATEWIEEYSLLQEHHALLKQAQAVQDWKRFYQREQARTVEEQEKLAQLAKELPSVLLQLKERRGVLTYRPEKGVALMSLQR